MIAPLNQPLKTTMSTSDETYVFMLRVWTYLCGPCDGERAEWCGKVQNILSSKGSSFDDRLSLVGLIQSMPPDLQPEMDTASETLIGKGESSRE